MDKLVAAINKLTELVRTAAEELHEEPNKALEEKLDKMIEQNDELLKHNEEIRSSLLLLLELNRQHLPSIASNIKKPSQPMMPKPAPLPQKPAPDDFSLSLLGLPPDMPRE
ncbi:MAG: hypothetical protein V1702_02030 [Candidatus Woesearchaeota archaeon]